MVDCALSHIKEPEDINADDEVEDTCDNKEDDLGAVEEQRSVILHLLSQLKLGMDLTRVSNRPLSLVPHPSGHVELHGCHPSTGETKAGGW